MGTSGNDCMDRINRIEGRMNRIQAKRGKDMAGDINDAHN
jgi:hypothetical protein